MTRGFLTVIGMAYLGLGIWCAVAPQRSARAIGFELQPGQGQSEFLTVYGGLEVALGVLFLWPLLRAEDVRFSLLACLVVHAGLVVFRTFGFFLYSGFPATTYVLAAVEWTVLIVSGALFFSAK